MPGTATTQQTPTSSGAVVNYAAAVAAASIVNQGRTIILVKNASGSPVNVTIKTTAVVDGVTAADKVVAVADGAEKVIGPFPPGIYNFSDGTMEVDLSATTGVTMAVLQVP